MDSSALLALMQHEIGCEVVENLLQEQECVISSVNLTEVATKLIDQGLAPDQLMRVLKEFDVQPIDFDQEQALAAAKLRIATKSAGLSLGDRTCLALAQCMQGCAVTADHAWSDVKDALAVKVLQIR